MLKITARVKTEKGPVDELFTAFWENFNIKCKISVQNGIVDIMAIFDKEPPIALMQAIGKFGADIEFFETELIDAEKPQSPEGDKKPPVNVERNLEKLNRNSSDEISNHNNEDEINRDEINKNNSQNPEEISDEKNENDTENTNITHSKRHYKRKNQKNEELSPSDALRLLKQNLTEVKTREDAAEVIVYAIGINNGSEVYEKFFLTAINYRQFEIAKIKKKVLEEYNIEVKIHNANYLNTRIKGTFDMTSTEFTKYIVRWYLIHCEGFENAEEGNQNYGDFRFEGYEELIKNEAFKNLFNSIEQAKTEEDAVKIIIQSIDFGKCEQSRIDIFEKVILTSIQHPEFAQTQVERLVYTQYKLKYDKNEKVYLNYRVKRTFNTSMGKFIEIVAACYHTSRKKANQHSESEETEKENPSGNSKRLDSKDDKSNNNNINGEKLNIPKPLIEFQESLWFFQNVKTHNETDRSLSDLIEKILIGMGISDYARFSTSEKREKLILALSNAIKTEEPVQNIFERDADIETQLSFATFINKSFSSKTEITFLNESFTTDNIITVEQFVAWFKTFAI